VAIGGQLLASRYFGLQLHEALEVSYLALALSCRR
jgi:hypothetical protein